MKPIKSQVELFKYVWANRPHFCFVTGQRLDKFIDSSLALSMFAHVLRKSAFQQWRLDPNNIVLLSPSYLDYSVHRLFDDGVYDEIKKFEKKSGKSFQILFEFERSQHVRHIHEFGKTVPERKIVDKYLTELDFN